MSHLEFRKLLKNKKYVAFTKKVSSGKYDKIDWFNLELEIENICNIEGVSYDENYRVYEHILENRFVEIKKYVVKPKDLNIVLEDILKKLVKNLDISLKVSDFYNKDYQIESIIKNQVTSTLNYLLSYGIITKEYSNGLGVHYKTNSDFWNKRTDSYIINDTSILQELVPIIASYVKNGNIKTYNIQTLIYKFSKIIEYAIIPSISHNKFIDMEFVIQSACGNQEEIEIIYNNQNIQITPIKIILKDDNNKYIQIKNGSKIEYIPLNKIEILQEDFTQEATNPFIKTLSTNLDFKYFAKEEEKNIEVILECDTFVYEYFQMKPLKNMQIFDTDERLKEFHSIYEIKPIDTKFYIVASDKEDMIISTILHTLPYSQILKPFDLNNKLINKFKTYIDKVGIDICKDNTPPSNNPTSQKSTANDIERLQQDTNSKNINNDNIDYEELNKHIF